MDNSTFRGGDAVMAALERIAKRVGDPGVLRVGFLENALYPDGTPVAAVAAIDEFGAPAVNIPPRPYFRQMIAAKSPGWGESLGNLAVNNDYDMAQTFAQMGDGIKGQLQDSIRALTTPALAPATVARKGFDKPLIDTSHMINSVDYDVKP